MYVHACLLGTSSPHVRGNHKRAANAFTTCCFARSPLSAILRIRTSLMPCVVYYPSATSVILFPMLASITSVFISQSLVPTDLIKVSLHVQADAPDFYSACNCYSVVFLKHSLKMVIGYITFGNLHTYWDDRNNTVLRTGKAFFNQSYYALE